MTDPLFWLVLSLLFVTVSLTIVLVVAIPTLRELSRAARSAEKLFDTLRREFPPTLQSIRLTGLEISDLTDDVSEGVQSAGNVVKQVDQSLTSARKQAQRVHANTRSVVVGLKAAWRTFMRSQRPMPRRPSDRLSTSRYELELDHTEPESFTMAAERSRSRGGVAEPRQGQPSNEPQIFNAAINSETVAANSGATTDLPKTERSTNRPAPRQADADAHNDNLE